MTAKPSRIDVVTASAGTGKTHQLTEAFLEAITEGIDSAHVLGTTFTRKAAAELMERVRQRLIEQGHRGAAQGVLAGYIGTVNAVFGRLVTDFALDAGRSPVAEVISEERVAGLFAAASDPVIQTHAPHIDPAANRMGLDDWRAMVLKVCDLARQNDIAPDALASCADRSLNGLMGLLPAPDGSEATLDSDLRQAVNDAIAALQNGGDTTNVTANVLAVLEQVAAKVRNGRALTWADWARLSRLEPAVRSRSTVEPVKILASRHPRHPRLHADLRTVITGVFQCAAEAMDGYDRFKRGQGLVDFIDQEREALRLLDREDVRQALAERLRVALVDEFQDTSPIQLALFTKLASIVGRSLWVGDPKQAIYGFRGTDPELMQEVVARVVPETGGAMTQLTRNYRSRPSPVAFANDLFGAAFPPTGIAREQVLVKDCARTDAPDQGTALELWSLNGGNWEKALGALAEGVVTLMNAPDRRRVGIRGTADTRPLVGSDIAILCRSNERCGEVAEALAKHGLKVAIGRQGLCSTLEAALALSALRYLADPSDTLAMVELEHLGGGNAEQPAWLEAWLRPDAAHLAREASPILQALDGVRDRLPHLTPAEALDLAITAGGVAEQVKRWGNVAERLANLDALRGLARAYEGDCQASRGAATAAGLIRFLAQAPGGGHQPASADIAAVQVMTYHAAKGLEWPVVILLDLQAEPKASPFGISVESPDVGIDPWEPLAGRWIRYWPWPYDRQMKDVYLDGTADESAEMQAARRRAHAEAVRLLYVGVTRARDYAILAVRPGRSGWLDALHGDDGRPALILPALDTAGDAELLVGNSRHPVTVVPLSDAGTMAAGKVATASSYTLPSASTPQPVHPPLRLAPSQTGIPAELSGVPPMAVRLGARLPFTGTPDMTDLGEAVHGFLAVDQPGNGREQRLALAQRQLSQWSVTALTAEHIVEAGDRLWSYLDVHFPGYRRLTEWPVHGRVGLQRVSGRIDLLLDGPDGLVVIDHKTFPGDVGQWTTQAMTYAPQLALYGQLVEAATGRSVTGYLVHMPVVGALLDIGNTVRQGLLHVRSCAPCQPNKRG